MSKPYDTDRDPVVHTSTIHIAGCLMQIQTTQSGAVLLNGDLVQAFQQAPGTAAASLTKTTQTTPIPPQTSEGDDTELPDVPF